MMNGSNFSLMSKASTIHFKNPLHAVNLTLLISGGWVVSGLLALLSYPAMALPEDSQQPIQISSNSAVKDKNTVLT